MAQSRSMGAGDFVITYIKGEGSLLKFWALPRSALDTVKNIESLFLRKSHKLETVPNFIRSDQIPLNSKCVVRSNIKGTMWCRAQVLAHRGMAEVLVRLMDYGNVEIIPVTSVRNLKDNIFTLPPQAVEYILADVIPARGSKWTSRDIKFCERQLLHKTLSYYVITEYMKLPVVRIAKKGESDPFVQRLINGGMAIIKEEQPPAVETWDVLNSTTNAEEHYRNKMIDASTNTDNETYKFLEMLSDDFSAFYESKINTDCILKVEDGKFPAHRAILSARSPVFSAMFHHDTTENHSGEVNIVDVEGDAMSNFLYYLYSGKIKGLSADTAAAMYAVADKYSLIEYRNKCFDILKHNLTINNICDAALLAHIHGESELEERVIDFIGNHLKELGENEKWQDFSKTKPLLVNKLLYTAFVACKEYKFKK